MNAEQAAALREAFPESSIGYLPKANVQLAYVGHAAVTDRLLAVDPEWSWEPVAFDERGLPAITQVGKDACLWIRLTVCGVTRYGVGTAGEGSFELSKQLISDALRNAAMRFGVALDLWAKEDLHAEPPAPPRVRADADTIARVEAALEALDETVRVELRDWWKAERLGSLTPGHEFPLTEEEARRVLARIDEVIG